MTTPTDANAAPPSPPADAVPASSSPTAPPEHQPAAGAVPASEPAPDLPDQPPAEATVDDSAAPTPADAQPSLPEPRPPVPKPGPAAVPRPGPRLGVASRPAAPVVVAPPAHTDADIERALEWGRVDPDGTVFVKEGKSERAVGQFPGVPAREALTLYVKRFLDLEAQVKLFGARLESLTQKDIDQTLASLKQALAEPAAVGDLEGLRASYRSVKAHAAAVRQRIEAERAAVKVQALAERAALIERVEAITEQPAEQINWKQASNELREVLDDWRQAQRTGPKVDRAAEDELWQRFSHARANFDRKRRTFFAELDKRQGATKLVKEKIVEEAEKLATSQDWGAAGRTFRDLMDRWRAAGRLARRDDDALWER
ncbi:MAG: DUF349 domain-containing protein, partial [Bifidobacteriaceae bacterium]|nr:DUF349 domain-containing protein [Bifidobacteriaceae bacterium]